MIALGLELWKKSQEYCTDEKVREYLNILLSNYIELDIESVFHFILVSSDIKSSLHTATASLQPQAEYVFDILNNSIQSRFGVLDFARSIAFKAILCLFLTLGDYIMFDDFHFTQQQAFDIQREQMKHWKLMKISGTLMQ